MQTEILQTHPITIEIFPHFFENRKLCRKGRKNIFVYLRKDWVQGWNSERVILQLGINPETQMPVILVTMLPQIKELV